MTTKKCPCCGRIVEWESLRLLGREDYGPGGTIEFRNCRCGSTMGVKISGAPESVPPGASGR